MNKKLLILTIIIIILGVLTNLSKLVLGSIESSSILFFTIGLFILSLIPYITYYFLSSWFKSYWISIISGLIILGLDIEAHMSVFVYPTDAQAPLVLIFSPAILFVICIVSFIVLSIIDNIIYFIRNKSLKFKINKDIPFKHIFIKYICPFLGIVCIYIIAIVLMTSPSWMEKPIHKAITYGDFDQVKKLVESGADIEALNIADETPLFAATGTGKVDIIKYLISKKAKINFIDKKLNMSPLMWACFVDQDKSALVLIENGADVDLSNAQGYTALYQCADQNRPEVVKKLIQSGSNINSADKTGKTPLMVAAMRGSNESVNRLLEAKPDLELTDNSGFTALHWAAYYGNLEIVKALLEAGADKSIKSKIGKTPADYARMNKFSKVEKLLNSQE